MLPSVVETILHTRIEETAPECPGRVCTVFREGPDPSGKRSEAAWGAYMVVVCAQKWSEASCLGQGVGTEDVRVRPLD